MSKIAEFILPLAIGLGTVATVLLAIPVWNYFKERRTPNISLTEAYHLLAAVAPLTWFQESFYQELLDRKIQAWGRLPQSTNAWNTLGPEIPIPHVYWTDSAFDWISAGPNRTERTIPGVGKPEYRKVRFNADQIRQLASKF